VIRNVLLDTGPLIALIDQDDRQHAWAKAQFDQVLPPLLTCEAVLTEACHLAPRAGRPITEPLLLLERGVLRLAFNMGEKFREISSLMNHYANVPMSLADACLVCMSELVANCVILTLDGDFRIYRRHKRQRIPLLMPPHQ
jgi:predicted nucleic acid-binding protein